MIVGVDVGGTKIAAARVGAGGLVGPLHETPTPAADGARAVLDTVAGLVRAAAGGDVDAIAGIGVATAGTVDADRGVVLSATAALPGWAGVHVPAELRARLSPSLPVSVGNDVDALALGEAWTGAAAGAASALVVAAGTGIGGALLLAGRVLRGAHGCAGEIGHIPSPDAQGLRCPCGVDGHVEAAAAGPAIARAYAAAGGPPSSGARIAELAATGEPQALAVLTAAGAALGRAIAGVVTAVDPERVVVGGGVARSGDPWWRALRSAARAELIPPLRDVPIEPAAHGVTSAVAGAARALVEEGARV